MATFGTIISNLNPATAPIGSGMAAGFAYLGYKYVNPWIVANIPFANTLFTLNGMISFETGNKWSCAYGAIAGVYSANTGYQGFLLTDIVRAAANSV
jgi:hypothetical protein